MPFLRTAKIDTHLFWVINYTRDYSERLYLLPSTDYNIFIQSVTNTSKQSNIEKVEFRTPSAIDFNGNLEFKVQASTSTVLLNMPDVLNDTSNSMLHVIVKGPNSCRQYLKLPESLSEKLGVMNYEIIWQAAEVSVCIYISLSITNHAKFYIINGVHNFID